jgi:hypothetical protein
MANYFIDIQFNNTLTPPINIACYISTQTPCSSTHAVVDKNCVAMASVAIAAGIAEANASPSVSLARRMKTYGNIKYQPNITYSRGLTTTRGVVEYKSDIFFKNCHPASPSYDDSIDFDELARELFIQGEMCASRDNHVFRAVEDLSTLHGFYPKKEKEAISPATGKGSPMMRRVSW